MQTWGEWVTQKVLAPKIILKSLLAGRVANCRTGKRNITWKRFFSDTGTREILHARALHWKHEYQWQSESNLTLISVLTARKTTQHCSKARVNLLTSLWQDKFRISLMRCTTTVVILWLICHTDIPRPLHIILVTHEVGDSGFKSNFSWRLCWVYWSCWLAS